MKIKQNVYITRPADFAKDPNGDCYTLDPTRNMDGTWTFVTEVEFELEIDRQEVVDIATKEIDEQIGKAQCVIDMLERKKQELLALPAPDSES